MRDSPHAVGTRRHGTVGKQGTKDDDTKARAGRQRQAFPKQQRRRGHHQDGAKRIEQRGDADADLAIGHVHEHPADTEGGT